MIADDAAIGDRVELNGLRVVAVCGVLESEQAQAQPFEIDVALHLDLRAAGDSDDLDDTVDYGALGEAIARIASEERFSLLERFAQRIADVSLADDRVEAATVAVRKLRPPMAQDLDSSGVRIVRPRTPSE